MCRVNGRLLRASTRSERHLLLSLGVTELRVPRKFNPYQVARVIRRVALGPPEDMKFLKSLVRRPLVPAVPVPSPDLDTPMPSAEDDVVAA